MKPTTEQILSALNKLVSENKTELKAGKVELGMVDDLKKSNTEGKKVAQNVSKQGEKMGKLYDSIRDEVSNYSKLNKIYEKEIKSAKNFWKEHGDIMDDIAIKSKELGINRLDVPQYKEAVGIAKELRAAGNDTIRYPSIKI
jgi:hypothetical protein